MPVSLQSRTFISFSAVAVTVCSRRDRSLARPKLKFKHIALKLICTKSNNLALCSIRIAEALWLRVVIADARTDSGKSSQRLVIINANDCYGNILGKQVNVCPYQGPAPARAAGGASLPALRE